MKKSTNGEAGDSTKCIGENTWQGRGPLGGGRKTRSVHRVGEKVRIRELTWGSVQGMNRRGHEKNWEKIGKKTRIETAPQDKTGTEGENGGQCAAGGKERSRGKWRAQRNVRPFLKETYK